MVKQGHKESFSRIEELVKVANRLKEQPIPINIKQKSSLESFSGDKPAVIIFGEQHAGASFNQVNFAKTNRALLNTLTEICKDKDLPISSFIKEGCSPLAAYDKLKQKSIEELLVLGLSPLQIYINKVNPKMKVQVVESLEIFLEFALLSLLYASRPGNARFADIEIQRIIYIITDDIDYDKNMLIKKICLRLLEKLKLNQVIEEQYIKYIKVETEFGELGLPALRSHIESKVSKEALYQFDLIMAKAILETGYQRDAYIANQVSKLDPGIYPMFFGEYHIENLVSEFNKLGLGYLVLSPFV